jgi:hypothetical protein
MSYYLGGLDDPSYRDGDPAQAERHYEAGCSRCWQVRPPYVRVGTGWNERLLCAVCEEYEKEQGNE